MIKVIIHIQNEDPVLGEIENMPDPSDISIHVKNPSRKDGKDLHYLDDATTSVIWPLSRINFIEIIPGKEEDTIISHVRE